MGAGQSGLGLTILGVFAAFYFLTVLRQSRRETGALEKFTGVAGIATPLGLTAYFASSAELSPHLFPLAALLALLLSLASVRLGREPGMDILPFLAAAADVGIMIAWTNPSNVRLRALMGIRPCGDPSGRRFPRALGSGSGAAAARRSVHSEFRRCAAPAG